MISDEKYQSKNQWLSSKMLTSHSRGSNVRGALLHAAMAQAGKGSSIFTTQFPSSLWVSISNQYTREGREERKPAP